ncbi:hypothetical protein Tcan_00360 [Toxocara canis]|uniref:Uncharacterized protein n=1 Tax=Toxocara canis TaxID=6265 RepID=A0A0B2VDS6_TOXCA|nr:hypothetical protein Tcan_00360 [Toxocara canis]
MVNFSFCAMRSVKAKNALTINSFGNDLTLYEINQCEENVIKMRIVWNVRLTRLERFNRWNKLIIDTVVLVSSKTTFIPYIQNRNHPSNSRSVAINLCYC